MGGDSEGEGEGAGGWRGRDGKEEEATTGGIEGVTLGRPMQTHLGRPSKKPQPNGFAPVRSQPCDGDPTGEERRNGTCMQFRKLWGAPEGSGTSA